MNFYKLKKAKLKKINLIACMDASGWPESTIMTLQVTANSGAQAILNALQNVFSQ